MHLRPHLFSSPVYLSLHTCTCPFPSYTCSIVNTPVSTPLPVIPTPSSINASLLRFPMGTNLLFSPPHSTRLYPQQRVFHCRRVTRRKWSQPGALMRNLTCRGGTFKVLTQVFPSIHYRSCCPVEKYVCVQVFEFHFGAESKGKE